MRRRVRPGWTWQYRAAWILGNPLCFTSAAATNGSAFAGLNANSPFYNLTLALGMFVGRFFVVIPVLAIAGSLAAQPVIPRSSGTLRSFFGRSIPSAIRARESKKNDGASASRDRILIFVGAAKTSADSPPGTEARPIESNEA